MEDKKLNPAESLELITSMIRNTQTKLEKNAGTTMIAMGYITVFTSLLIWCLYYVFNFTHNIQYLWLIIPVIGWPLAIFLKRKGGEKKSIKTYIDTIIGYVWAVLGFSMLAISIVTFFTYMPILFIILVLMCIGTIITGLITKFRFLVINGIIGFALSFLCLIYQDLNSVLIFAGEFILICIIPGHVLNYKCRKCSKN